MVDMTLNATLVGDDYEHAGKAGRALQGLNVESYCQKCGDFGQSSVPLFIGCVMMVISQVVMMVSTASEKERVAMEMSTCHRTADGMKKNNTREMELGENLRPGPPMPSTRF